MQKTLLLTLVVTFSCFQVRAQTTTQPVCGIFLDYDANGNRVRRMYDCRIPPDPYAGTTDPPSGPSGSRMAPPERGKTAAFTVQVNPNPTSGPYVITLSAEPTQSIPFRWYNEHGQLMTSGLITGRHTSGSIDEWPGGCYLLHVQTPWGNETFRITKLTNQQ